MATVLLWYHDGSLSDGRGWPTPVINEPSVVDDDIAEVVNTPAASQPAPNNSMFAVVETDLRVRYTVRRPGQATPIATTMHKYLGAGQGQIAVRAGETIHFIDG